MNDQNTGNSKKKNVSFRVAAEAAAMAAVHCIVCIRDVRSCEFKRF